MSMNNTKHSPGPWNAAINVRGFDSQIVGRNGLIAEVYGKDPDCAFSSTFNAQLIAAAPELLEALKHAEARTRIQATTLRAEAALCDRAANIAHADECDRWANIFAATIAKAEGL